MKKKICLLLLSFCTVLISACENNIQFEETNNITNLEDNNVPDKSTNEENNKKIEPKISNCGNGLIVVPGTYEVGDYVANTDYLITCKETNYSMQVIVFESKDNYNNYQNTKRVTNGEEFAAIEQYALYDYYLKSGEQGYLGLENGYVLLIKDGNGKLNEISMQDTDSNTAWYRSDNIGLCRGVYFVGNDIKAAQYSLTCIDSYMEVVVFENKDTYKAYHQSSRFTGGEESDAIEQNAKSYEYMYSDKTLAINLQKGNVLMISNGIGDLEILSQ